MGEHESQAQVAVIGSQPEALLLSVLFAESKIPSFLVGTVEPLRERRISRSPLDEARWLLGIHSASGKIRLVGSVEDLPPSQTWHMIFTTHAKSGQDSVQQDRIIKAVSRTLSKGSTFTYTGLSKPGYTSLIGEVIQSQSGIKIGKGIGLCHLPLLWNGESLTAFKETPRIIAGADIDAVTRAQELFLRVFPAISSTERIKAAEAAGLFTPIYRDVIGALELELARLCVGEGVDYTDALNLCRGLGLNNLNSPRPFPGRDSVGSEIALSFAKLGTGPRLIRAARKVNEESNKQIVAMVKNALARCGQRLRHSKIAILGLDGLGLNSSLGTETPGLLQTLKRRGASISVYPGNSFGWMGKDAFGDYVRVERNITKAVENAHCALIALDHLENGEVNPQKLAAEMTRPAAICDLTGVLEASNVERAGLFYTSIGRGSPEA